jgi:GNAT superfamily N-acetyltransferase
VKTIYPIALAPGIPSLIRVAHRQVAGPEAVSVVRLESRLFLEGNRLGVPALAGRVSFGQDRGNVILQCKSSDFEAVLAVINDAAMAYQGVIPEDRWHQPYMSAEELRREISRGVQFWGYWHQGELAGVMGIQDVKDVTLIRHAYVRTRERNKGIGTELLRFLLHRTSRPVLVGTWKAAVWAVKFYQRSGLTLVTEEEKNRLLKTYWTIPERQIETSVVLADRNWFQQKAEDRNG